MISICSWKGQILCEMEQLFLWRRYFYKLLKRRYIFQLTKYEHKDLRESNDYGDTNLSFVGFAK